MWHFMKKNSWKRELASKDECTTKKTKVIRLRVRVTSDRSGVIIAGNVDTAAIWKTLDVEPEELGECKLIDTNEEYSCDKK